MALFSEFWKVPNLKAHPYLVSVFLLAMRIGPCKVIWAPFLAFWTLNTEAVSHIHKPEDFGGLNDLQMSNSWIWSHSEERDTKNIQNTGKFCRRQPLPYSSFSSLIGREKMKWKWKYFSLLAMAAVKWNFGFLQQYCKCSQYLQGPGVKYFIISVWAVPRLIS